MKAYSQEDSHTSQVAVSVVSALSGEPLATVILPKTTSVAILKLEVQKAIGHSAFQFRFILPVDDCDAMDHDVWCGQDFDSLETALKGMDTVKLALLVTQREQDHGSLSLPFVACERDYLPASGCVDDALNLSHRYRSASACVH